MILSSNVLSDALRLLCGVWLVVGWCAALRRVELGATIGNANL